MPQQESTGRVESIIGSALALACKLHRTPSVTAQEVFEATIGEPIDDDAELKSLAWFATRVAAVVTAEQQFNSYYGFMLHEHIVTIALLKQVYGSDFDAIHFYAHKLKPWRRDLLPKFPPSHWNDVRDRGAGGAICMCYFDAKASWELPNIRQAIRSNRELTFADRLTVLPVLSDSVRLKKVYESCDSFIRLTYLQADGDPISQK